MPECDASAGLEGTGFLGNIERNRRVTAGVGISAVLGRILPKKNDITAATADTPRACTCSKLKLPRIKDLLVDTKSKSPIFACSRVRRESRRDRKSLTAVLNLEERFISRFPFRLFSIGIRIYSSLTRRSARQAYGATVSTARRLGEERLNVQTLVPASLL